MRTPVTFRHVLSMLALICLAAPCFGETARRPNVLLVISDDQGYGEFGFTGNRNILTPNLDKLAEQSAVFENFTVAPACSPTRSSLMMGRNHFKTGVWGVGEACNILDDEVFMPQFFKKAGYATALFGKGDSVQRREQRPWHLGVDKSSVVWGYDHKDPRMFEKQLVGNQEKLVVVNKKGYTCNINVDDTIDFIRSNKGRPWWVDLAFIIPHQPWEAAPEYEKIYLDKGYSKLLANCWGSITQMDASLGRLMEALEEMGEAEDTVVVFFSDNGPSIKGCSEKDVALRNPQELRGAKATIYENGFRVPLLVRWPGHVDAGWRKQFTCVEDILPTLLDISGIDDGIIPQHLPFDGINIKPFLLKPDTPDVDREVFRMEFIGGGLRRGGENGRWIINDAAKIPMSECQVTLRGPRFKLYHDRGEDTLYDLETDPQEAEDVSREHPELLARYKVELERQFTAVMTSGRACRMGIQPVGRNQARQNVIAGIQAQRISAGLSADPRKRAISGFAEAGCSAVYAIKVLEDGAYRLTITGLNLESAKGCYVEIAGKRLSPENTTAETLTFAPVGLDRGNYEFTFGVTGSSGAGREAQATVRMLRFTQTKVK